MQRRTRETRKRIIDGLVSVLVRDGLAGVTHRSVAKAAGVSLAATTRHFKSKEDMLAEVTDRILGDYVSDFQKLRGRIEADSAQGIRSLHDVLSCAVRTGLFRERDKSLAWCELILQGGRSAEGRARTRLWYEEIDRSWLAISAALPDKANRADTYAAVDTAIGLLFLLHPCGLAEEEFNLLIGHRKSVPDLIGATLATSSEPIQGQVSDGAERVLEAAIEVLVRSGPQAVTFRAVSEIAGLSRSAPSYHFPSVDQMLEAAQMALFERAKGRYRSAFPAREEQPTDGITLSDLSSAIFFSEALQHAEENLAYLTVWIRAAERKSLRRPILAALLDQQRAWTVRLESVEACGSNALAMEALFLGKLVRAMVAGPDIREMALARGQFLRQMVVK